METYMETVFNRMQKKMVESGCFYACINDRVYTVKSGTIPSITPATFSEFINHANSAHIYAYQYFVKQYLAEQV
jgi:hypothetical protein